MKKSRIPRNPYDALALVLFRDTMSARMLRALHYHRRIQQALFMAEYHRRCSRKTPSRSSFGNNFGCRFEQYARCVNGATYVKRWDIAKPLRVINVERDGRAHDSMRNLLVWSGPDLDVLLAAMSDARLQRCYELAERQLVEPRATDAENEMRLWVEALRGEIDHRASGTRRAA